MNDNLILGMVLGFIVGGLVVHSSKSAQQFIENGKEAIKEKIDSI